MSKMPTNALGDLAAIRGGLTAARSAAGLTQDGLATKLARSRSSVDRFENNRTDARLYEVAIHARALGYRLRLEKVDASEVTHEVAA